MSAVPPPASPVGQTLDDRYRVIRELGRGGMGSAWLAQDERLARDVVVKMPHATLLVDPGFRDRFELEARALVGLDVPGVVALHDMGEWQGVPYVVLQYLSGGSLQDRLHRTGGRQTPHEVCRWVIDAASALDAVHARNFLHRDVKPANILFDGEGRAHLGDFGIAKALGQTMGGLTTTGTSPGSPEYMAPEAVQDGSPTRAYDQYSLAAVVFRVLVGEAPHTASSPLALLHKKATVPPPRVQELVTGLDPRAAAAINRALSMKAADRFPTCRAFADAFVAGVGTFPPGYAPVMHGTDLPGPGGGFGDHRPTDTVMHPSGTGMVLPPTETGVATADVRAAHATTVPNRPRRRSRAVWSVGLLVLLGGAGTAIALQGGDGREPQPANGQPGDPTEEPSGVTPSGAPVAGLQAELQDELRNALQELDGAVAELVRQASLGGPSSRPNAEAHRLWTAAGPAELDALRDLLVGPGEAPAAEDGIPALRAGIATAGRLRFWLEGAAPCLERYGAADHALAAMVADLEGPTAAFAGELQEAWASAFRQHLGALDLAAAQQQLSAVDRALEPLPAVLQARTALLSHLAALPVPAPGLTGGGGAGAAGLVGRHEQAVAAARAEAAGLDGRLRNAELDGMGRAFGEVLTALKQALGAVADEGLALAREHWRKRANPARARAVAEWLLEWRRERLAPEMYASLDELLGEIRGISDRYRRLAQQCAQMLEQLRAWAGDLEVGSGVHRAVQKYAQKLEAARARAASSSQQGRWTDAVATLEQGIGGSGGFAQAAAAHMALRGWRDLVAAAARWDAASALALEPMDQGVQDGIAAGQRALASGAIAAAADAFRSAGRDMAVGSPEAIRRWWQAIRGGVADGDRGALETLREAWLAVAGGAPLAELPAARAAALVSAATATRLYAGAADRDAGQLAAEALELARQDAGHFWVAAAQEERALHLRAAEDPQAAVQAATAAAEEFRLAGADAGVLRCQQLVAAIEVDLGDPEAAAQAAERLAAAARASGDTGLEISALERAAQLWGSVGAAGARRAALAFEQTAALLTAPDQGLRRADCQRGAAQAWMSHGEAANLERTVALLEAAAATYGELERQGRRAECLALAGDCVRPGGLGGGDGSNGAATRFYAAAAEALGQLQEPLESARFQLLLRVYRCQAECMGANGQTRKAGETLAAAIRLAEDRQDVRPLELADLLFAQGQAMLGGAEDTADPKKWPVFERAAELYRKAGDKEAAAAALDCIRR